jgi:hypothetical protein
MAWKVTVAFTRRNNGDISNDRTLTKTHPVALLLVSKWHSSIRILSAQPTSAVSWSAF